MIERISRQVKSQVALDSYGLPMQGTQREGSPIMCSDLHILEL